MTKTHISLAVAIALNSAAVFADDVSQIERITVSSDFRYSDLDALAASATVIADEEISVRQAQHLEDVLNISANVNFASGASRGRFIQIRGIGERSQFAEPINPSVGFLNRRF